MKEESSNSIHHYSVQDNEISIKEFILKLDEWYGYLKSKWVIILIISICGGALGFIYAYKSKPIYFATTTFVLEGGSDGMLTQYSGLASMVGVDVGGGRGAGIFQGDNLLELYKSRRMLEKCLLSEVDINGEKQQLIQLYIDINELDEKWANHPKLNNIDFSISGNQKFTRIQDSIISDIVNDIRGNYLVVSKPDKKLSIIKVEVKAENEHFAKAFNDQIVKTVNDFYVQTMTKKALENLNILQYQTDSVRSVLNGAIYQIAENADATPNLNPSRLVLRSPAQRSQVNVEANKAILGQLVQNLELSKLSLRKETPLIQVVDTPVFPLEKIAIRKSRGIIAGTLLAGFLIVIIVVLQRIIKTILA